MSTEPSQSNLSFSHSRRNFIKTGGTLAAGLGACGLPLASAKGNVRGRKLKIGIVGLGARGSGAIHNILSADPDTLLWAVGDIFPDRLGYIKKYERTFAGRIDTRGRQFVGFDAYQRVIDSGVDIVLLTTPPVFRPLHFEAAVAAGKHVFLEKPFAIDAPGLRSVIANAKKAQTNGQSVLTGLAWRYTTYLQELKARIADGAIGDILTCSSSYCGGARPNKMPDPAFKPACMSDMEWSLRYWQNFIELGGDGAVEYMIHGIDRMTWFMDDMPPSRCYANGGNIAPVKGGNSWDSFNMRFEYEDGRIADFFGRQISGTYSPSGDTIIGTAGRAFASRSSATLFNKDGKEIWNASGYIGYENEQRVFTSHIRAGQVYNDIIDQTANSHLAALMGRTAGYTGQLITSKQYLESEDLLIPNLKEVNFNTHFTARKSALQGKTTSI